MKANELTKEELLFLLEQRCIEFSPEEVAMVRWKTLNRRADALENALLDCHDRGEFSSEFVRKTEEQHSRACKKADRFYNFWREKLREERGGGAL